MRCQEGWTGQVLFCGLTCTTQYRLWPGANEPENCSLCAYITIVAIQKVVLVVINHSFIKKYSETIIEILFSTEIIFPWKRRSKTVGTVSVDSQQCVMVAKNKVAVNSKSHHRQHREHESIVRFRDSLHLTFKLSQYFSFLHSYRAHLQMPLKHF